MMACQKRLNQEELKVAWGKLKYKRTKAIARRKLILGKYDSKQC